ncbi:MAG: ATP-binding protein [Saprospiraceae bacterium]|nr:ATP-binding protein [Saprospiraceae bacterium]
MPKDNSPQEILKKEIIRNSQQGFQADVKNLKSNMATQFRDYNEWVREYLVNAYDAQATWCTIEGRETEDSLIFTVCDNGHGMSKERVIDFFTLYRSRKNLAKGQAVGRFGVGKLSVAAVPGQRAFSLLTSDGSDCWEAKAGSLLTNDPVDLYQIRPIPSAGTTFEITFEKKESLPETLRKLEDILRRYCRYLDMDMVIYYPMEGDDGSPQQVRVSIGDIWYGQRKYSQRYRITIDREDYEIILELDPQASHELYQNRVLITQQYNLLCHDLENAFWLPYLRVRVDSRAFKMPFGRHCLADESCLQPLAEYIRTTLLPGYFQHLVEQLNERTSQRMDSYRSMIYEQSITLMQYQPGLEHSWSQLPVFKLFPDRNVSLVKLEKLVVEQGKLYVSEPNAVGVDYASFDGPVVVYEQMKNGLAFLQYYFQDQIINLSLKDVVIEAPTTLGLAKSKEEEFFQRHLGLHEDLSLLTSPKTSGDWENDLDFIFLRKEASNTDERLYDFSGQDRLRKDFQRLKWRAGHLVGKDGKTPCTSHKFIFKDEEEVVLNLNHPEIQQLVKLSTKAPKLAGHWAIAQCLTENTRILNYLSADARENLIMLDAIAKINAPEETTQPAKNIRKNRFRDLLDNTDYDFGLN